MFAFLLLCAAFLRPRGGPLWTLPSLLTEGKTKWGFSAAPSKNVARGTCLQPLWEKRFVLNALNTVTHFFVFRSCFKNTRFWELLTFIGAYFVPLALAYMKMDQCRHTKHQKTQVQTHTHTHTHFLSLQFLSNCKSAISSNHLISPESLTAVSECVFIYQCLSFPLWETKK